MTEPTRNADDPAFWRQAWAEGRTAFHQGVPNELLVAHAEVLAGRRRVLVPLCGKAEDLAFLAARGHDVVGVELVEDAVRAFFEEHGQTPVVTREGPLVRYQAGPVTLLAGDVFATTRENLGAPDAIYDRAALVALPADLRRRYAAHLRSVVDAGTPLLVIIFEYPQDQMSGPPFSVSLAHLRELYAGCTIELVGERPATLRQAGMPVTERCFAITMR